MNNIIVGMGEALWDVLPEGKKIGELVHPLRVALTGQGVGLGLFDTLAILGRESSMRRIELAIARAKT